LIADNMNWLKDKWQKFKKWIIVSVLGIGIVYAVGTTLPLGEEINLVWAKSYEQAIFNTPSGWFENNTYFYLENEDRYFIRGNDGSYFWGEIKNIQGLTEIQIVGTKFYDEFVDTDGSILKIETTEAEYRNLGQKDAIQPIKTKRVSLFFNNFVYAAITFDAVTNGNFSSNVSSITFSHTAAAGSNMVLVVFSTQINANPSSATYNAVSMINQITTSDNDLAGYYLIAPATGANNVVISYSGAGTFCAGWNAISYSGVDQDDPINLSTSQVATAGTSIFTTISPTTTDKTLIDTFFGEVNSLGLAATSTERLKFNDATDVCLGGTAEKITSAAGDYTMGWTWTSSIARNHIILALEPAVTGGAVDNKTDGDAVFKSGTTQLKSGTTQIK